MTTNKETFPFSTKNHCSVLFYWHSTESHMTTDFYRKCVWSVQPCDLCFQRSWSCQPITAHELPSAGQSIANYGSPLMHTEQCFDQGSTRLGETARPLAQTTEPWPLPSTWSNKCFPQQEAPKSIWPAPAMRKQ